MYWKKKYILIFFWCIQSFEMKSIIHNIESFPILEANPFVGRPSRGHGGGRPTAARVCALRPFAQTSKIDCIVSCFWSIESTIICSVFLINFGAIMCQCLPDVLTFTHAGEAVNQNITTACSGALMLILSGTICRAKTLVVSFWARLCKILEAYHVARVFCIRTTQNNRMPYQNPPNSKTTEHQEYYRVLFTAMSLKYLLDRLSPTLHLCSMLAVVDDDAITCTMLDC